MRRTTFFPALLALLIATTSVFAASKTIHLQVAAGETKRANTPVQVTVSLPKELADIRVAELDIGGETLWGQLTPPGLLAEKTEAKDGEVLRELHFILPQAKADDVSNVEVKLSTDGPQPSQTFSWGKDEGTHIDLTFAGQKIARYMKEAYDYSSGEARERTYKVFHHVFAPDGETLLTKGAGGRYTHHRGIFYGFSRATYGENLNKRADIWHCKGGVHQSHEDVVSQEAGPVLARHRLAIDWHGNDKEVFAKELRELTFYKAEGGLLVEFASKLTPVDGKLKLDGDPQHAGFQFRASNEVNAKTAGKTYYVRPDGVAQPGNYRQNKQQPWNAMSFVLDDQRYTVAYLDHPDNPKPAYYSERNYGRFGSYFVAEAEEGETIGANYRLWIQPGEMEVDEVAAHAETFADPPKVTVK